jgi:O-antigen/teichoic acid export membrane protein
MGIARTIAKNTLFNLIENGTDLITSFALGIILTRGLGTEQYGLYSYLIWLFGLSAILVNLGLSEMAKRFIAEAMGGGDRREAIGIVQLTLAMRVLLTLIVFGGLMLSSRYWGEQTGNVDNNVYVYILAIIILPYSVNYIFSGIFRGFQKYEYSAYMFLVTAPLRLILIIILITMGYGIQAVLITQGATMALGAFIGLYFLQRLIPFKELSKLVMLKAASVKRILIYSLTLAGIGILEFLAFSQAETYFIGRYCPVEQVGFYRLAERLATMVMTILPIAFGWVLTPAIAEQFGKGDNGKIKDIFLTSARYLMIITLPMTAGVIALARPIIMVLYGVEYSPVVILLQIFIFPLSLSSISIAANAVIFGINRPGFFLKMNLILAFVNIGMALWLIPLHGVLGAVIASSVSPILLAIVAILFASRKLGVAWPVRDALKVTAASVIMGVAIFFLQTRLSPVAGLFACIPVGVVIYLVATFAFRTVKQSDLEIIAGLDHALPKGIRERYIQVIKLIQKIIRWTQPDE